MKKTVTAIVVVLLLFCGISLLMLYFRCQQFNSPPEVPIYPGSILVEEIFGGTQVSPTYVYHYTSTASPDEIVEFYINNKAQCNQTSGIKIEQACSGDAKPFGGYFVSIDVSSYEAEALTRYSMSVLWTRCEDELFEP